MIVTPGILASLQRSVHSLLIKRVVHPDFMSHGVPVTCLVDSFPLVKPVYSANVQWIKLSLQVTRDQERDKDINFRQQHYSLASDGHYLYLHASSGMYKIGSGFSGTMKGHIYRHNASFYTESPGWLGIAAGTLYFKSGGPRSVCSNASYNQFS